MTANPTTVPPSISVAQLIDDYVYRYHYNMFPVVDAGRPRREPDGPPRCFPVHGH